METKTCFKCETEQPRTNFYAHPMMGDGLLGKCKTCAKTDVSANYHARRSQYVEYERERNQSTKRRADRVKQQKRARAKNVVKYKARQAVGNAVRDGRLFRRPCEKCGEKAQAHHDDYTKPLDVRWLCFKHHREHHGQIVS